MSSFYGGGDLNTSLAGRKDKSRSLSRDRNENNVLKDSFRVPTVYRIGSLHLSEGVNETLKFLFFYVQFTFNRFAVQTKTQWRVSEDPHQTWDTLLCHCPQICRRPKNLKVESFLELIQATMKVSIKSVFSYMYILLSLKIDLFVILLVVNLPIKCSHKRSPKILYLCGNVGGAGDRPLHEPARPAAGLGAPDVEAAPPLGLLVPRRYIKERAK